MGKKKTYKTIIAPLSFNLLANLSTDDLLERGHIPIGITVRAQRKKSDKSKDSVRILLPKEIGCTSDGKQLGAKKTIYTSTEVNPIRIAKLAKNGIENLKDFLKKQSAFRGMSFTVQELVTENKSTGQWVTWRRMCIKNGSRAKGLIIEKLDDVHFTKLTWEDVVSAADDMVFDACQFETMRYEMVSPECFMH